MGWIDRLKRFAVWDLVFQILAVLVLLALGVFALATDSCRGDAEEISYLRADEPLSQLRMSFPLAVGQLDLSGRRHSTSSTS